MDVVTISSAKDHQEILQTGVREQQHPKRPFIRHRGDWNPCMGNWTKLMWEADMLRLQREEMDQAKTLSQIEKSKENKGTERQERATERNLLFMIASGVVCQAMGHTGYGWCVSLLTLLAMGVQGQEVNEPWTPVLGTPEAEAGVRKVVSLEAPGSQTREGQQHTTKAKQATTPAYDSRCETNQPHDE